MFVTTAATLTASTWPFLSTVSVLSSGTRICVALYLVCECVDTGRSHPPARTAPALCSPSQFQPQLQSPEWVAVVLVWGGGCMWAQGSRTQGGGGLCRVARHHTKPPGIPLKYTPGILLHMHMHTLPYIYIHICIPYQLEDAVGPQGCIQVTTYNVQQPLAHYWVHSSTVACGVCVPASVCSYRHPWHPDSGVYIDSRLLLCASPCTPQPFLHAPMHTSMHAVGIMLQVRYTLTAGYSVPEAPTSLHQASSRDII